MPSSRYHFKQCLPSNEWQGLEQEFPFVRSTRALMRVHWWQRAYPTSELLFKIEYLQRIGSFQTCVAGTCLLTSVVLSCRVLGTVSSSVYQTKAMSGKVWNKRCCRSYVLPEHSCEALATVGIASYCSTALWIVAKHRLPSNMRYR